MFEYLSGFLRIIVTGPQRSGTTIVGAAIADDLGYYFYPEEQIRVWELWRVERLLKRTDHFVLQAPAICRYVHTIRSPGLAVVLVKRPVAEIVKSQERINWEGEERELRQYGLKEGVSAQVKYDYWDQYQRRQIEHPFEIEYESVATHPMWIPKECRTDFEPRQYQYG